MAEYIEREALMSKRWECRTADVDGETYGDLVDIASFIAEFPAADVVERKRGEWKYIGGDEWCCSCCGFVASTEGRWEPMTAKFCEECGADMRRDNND